jgi:hypothetical protein
LAGGGRNQGWEGDLVTTLEVLREAGQRGLTLLANGERLEVSPAYDCPRDFIRTLQEYKPALVSLLASKGRTWIELYSERLCETIFFCEDEETRDALIEAGASQWRIYTKAELRTLIAQNRIAPLSYAELHKLREIRKTFHGRPTK